MTDDTPDKSPGSTARHQIYWGCNWLHNWHSTNDGVLGGVFRTVTGDKWAVGWRGIASGPIPGNYTDHDQAYEIDQHCQYMDYDYGVVNNLYSYL